jgi:hypothetical protein
MFVVSGGLENYFPVETVPFVLNPRHERKTNKLPMTDKGLLVTARVRVSGTLFRAPERRTLKHGGLCVTATLTSTDGVRTQFWHIAAINETVQAELMGLSYGESVAVEGVLKAGLHNRNGEIELCFGVIAERALCLQPAGKKRTCDEQADADRPSGKAAPLQSECAEGA